MKEKMTNAASLRAKAIEVRQLAGAATDRMIRWQLDSLANQFDRLADQIESRVGARRALPATLDDPHRGTASS
jgi:hypothetical protein